MSLTPISADRSDESRIFLRRRPIPCRLIYYVFLLILLTFIYHIHQPGPHNRVEASIAHQSRLHHQHHHRQKRRSGFVGFSGAYCAKRPAGRQCCAHRDDNCTAAIRVPTGRVRRVKKPTTDQLFINDVEMMDHLCYCDRFCDRTKMADGGGGNDCCPDYEEVCENGGPSAVELGSITALVGEPQQRNENSANGANGESQLSSNGEECLESEVAYGYGQTIKRNCQTCTCLGNRWECDDAVTCLIQTPLLHQVQRDPAQYSWTAHNYTNFWARTLEEGVRFRLGTLFPEKSVKNMNEILIKRRELPLHFDARQKWPALASRPTVDQGDCASSWAVSTTQVAVDRLDILLDHDGPGTVGRRSTVPLLSAQQLLDCNAHKQRGCQGGFLDRAWWYIRKFGLVSGECYPYGSGVSRATGQCQISKAALSGQDGGVVSPSCANGISANNTVYKMTPPYRISVREEDIRTEIITNGPVQATFLVHGDFFMYKSGVYRHIERRREVSKPSASGYHSVKILGWGEEQSVTTGETIKYWICANSWGPQWGENGHFRIVRGVNHCEIESFIIGAWAKHPSSDGGLSGRQAAERLVATHPTPYTTYPPYTTYSMPATHPMWWRTSAADVWHVSSPTAEESIPTTPETEDEQHVSTDYENIEAITDMEETTTVSDTEEYDEITSERPSSIEAATESTVVKETELIALKETTTESTTTVAEEETTMTEEETTVGMTKKAEEMITVEMLTESADGELLPTTEMTTISDEEESTTMINPEEEGESTTDASTTPEGEDESVEEKQHNDDEEYDGELTSSTSEPTTTEFSEFVTADETTTTEAYEDLEAVEENEDDARLLEQSDDDESLASMTTISTTYSDPSITTTDEPDSLETQEIELAETITVNLSFDNEVTTANPLITTTAETEETLTTSSTEETETTVSESSASEAMTNSNASLRTTTTEISTIAVTVPVTAPLDRRMRRLRRTHREQRFRQRQLRWRLQGMFGRDRNPRLALH